MVEMETSHKSPGLCFPFAGYYSVPGQKSTLQRKVIVSHLLCLKECLPSIMATMLRQLKWWKWLCKNLLPLGVWSQWAYSELKLLFPNPHPGSVSLSVLHPDHSQLWSKLFQKFTGSTMLSPDTTVLFASKARNSTDGNYVTCTPVLFFIMPVVDISNWL